MLLAISVLLLWSSGASAEPPREHPRLRGVDGLGMYATIAKGPYGPEAAVPLTVHLVNVSEKPLLVNARMLFGPAYGPGDLSFELLGPDNRARTFDARIGAEDSSRLWEELAPGASIAATWDLQRSHDLDEDGIYAVQVIYENRQDAPAALGGSGWKGRLVSRIHHFRRKGERKER